MKTATQHLGTPQRHGAGWHVPSASGHGVYFVHINERGTARCTCPAFVYAGRQRRAACKHIRRVMMAVRQEVARG
jgi:hypothetical protein